MWPFKNDTNNSSKLSTSNYSHIKFFNYLKVPWFFNKYILKVPESGTTVLSIQMKVYHKYLNYIRFDGPHKGFMYNHININPRITKMPDPHIEISPKAMEIVKVLGKFSTVINYTPTALFLASSINDSIHLRSSYIEDIKRNDGSYKETIKTSIAIGTSIIAVYSCCFIGKTIGAIVGSILDIITHNIQFVAVGSVIGVIIGCYGSSIITNKVNNHVSHYLVNEKDQKEHNE
jgi:hypothetical protein